MIAAASDLVGALGWPGAVFSLAGAAWFGAKALAVIKNHNSRNGHAAEARGWTKATLEQNTACLKELGNTLHQIDRNLEERGRHDREIWTRVCSQLDDISKRLER